MMRFINCEGVDDELAEEMRRLIKKKGSNNRMVICRDCPGHRSSFKNIYKSKGNGVRGSLVLGLNLLFIDQERFKSF